MTWADDEAEAAEAEAARAQRATDELVQLRADLETARADAAMLRVALEDSQALLGSRARRWATEKAQLVDVVLALGDVIRILRHQPGRGEAPQ